MRYQPVPPLVRRWLAALLSLLLGLGPLATPAYAGLTPLADEPINIKNQAKPNIILTVDDSTSMLYDFLPDYVVSKYCRDGSGAMSAPCGYSGSPASAGPGGQYVSPQYIWEQPAVATLSTLAAPFPAYATGAGAVPASFSPQLFTNSGPGAGCNLTPVFPNPPSCTGGIDPGALPGIAKYAAASGSPQAGLPYEYWELWPAPVHNSALNHMYYNPRLTYDPPANPDATSFPQMDAGNTSNWTKVRADPFTTADPLDCSSEPCVDLTANVIVGQWCNSDWTQGNDDSGVPFVTNPGYCRTNGLVAAASAGAPAAIGDYMYPWAPTGITPNDVTSKVDTSVLSPWNSASPVNATVKAAWAGAQDAKYFYENDNVLWCDTTSPDWPQTGPSVPQTCQGISNPQTCTPNPVQPTCTGGVGGTCSGAIAAGTCNGFIAKQNCTGFSQGVCAGNQAGACNGQPGVCTAPGAGTCTNAPTCTGAVAAACNGVTREACVGGSPASCNNMVPETCNGGTQASCNTVAQTCNGAGAQTCANIHEIPPDPSTCTSGWVPAGCNLNPDPEGTCVYTTTCPPSTFAGNCSIQTAKVCTKNADCPFINGTCSVAGNSCASNSDCNLKRCQGAVSGSCNSNSDCPTTGGTCNKTGQACTITAGVSTCPPAGNCNNPPNAVCTSNPGSCPAISAHCATTTGTSCPVVTANSASCPVVPLSGACNNPPNAACTTAATCPAITNKCSNAPATTCASAAACPATGTCTNTGNACNVNANCAAVGPKTCTNSKKLGVVCTVNTDCDFVGTCTNSNSLGNPCITAAVCTTTGKCTNAGATFGNACATNSANSAACQDLGTCPAGSDSPTCTTVAASNPTAQCKKSGTCSNKALACTTNAQCTAVPGNCSAGKPPATSCTVNSDCNVANACGSSQNNGAVCDPANITATCIPLKGTCSIKGNACTTAADCAKSGFCSIQTTQVCFANSDCANQPGAMDPNTARCDTFGVSGGLNGDYTKTLLADANGAGKTCRRNNHAYASDGTTAAQNNYPSGKFTTPVGGENTAGMGCHATNRYAPVPRHYWKTEVEWCDKAISTAGDEWLGYGTPTGGSCQSFKDSSHVFPRFYEFGAAPGTDNVSQAAFARVDLVPAATYAHTWTDDSGTVQTVNRTYAEEMTNYANWFAYYRTRLLAVKTVTSLTFLGKNGGTLNLDDQFRVGFHTMFSFATSFVDIADFDATQKSAWATQLMNLKIPLGQETPTLNTISRIGEYYLNGTNPSLPGSTDPIVLSCQKNWHMFFTDGFTNQNSLPTATVGDQDDSLPATLPVGGTAVAITGLTPGAAWPPPFREDTSGSNAVSDSASDYVTNYWVTNLRPAMPENVATSTRDPASWPHQNFAAMSLGTEGILPSGNQSNVEAQLTTGALQWPKPQPTVYKPDQSGVDDLWHAAINGRGRFVNAQSADELKLGMGQILQDIVNQAGARTGAAFQSVSISGSSNFIYRTSFQPGWGASLRKIQIDPATGDEVSVIWDASTQLAAQLTVVPGVKDTPWFTDRMVATVDETGNPVPFLEASIGSNQLDSLAPGTTPRAKAILEFLRGNRNNEGTKVGQFRVRIGGLLGDIVDSQPVYVGPPRAPYVDGNDPGYTLNFKDAAAFKNRPARVYVGANDGMLHAFDDSTGNEAWAFVPSQLYRPNETGLGALSYQDGALPPFKHHFYVDATPRISDVNFGGGDADWHTILVGGLGKGGMSYYAIDVSQPNDITSETELAKRVLWQFTDPDLGYTYGRAIVAKTHAFGGQWVVIVPSGYNNVASPPDSTGEGKLFFLRASDGKLLTTLTTGSGSTSDPSGLAQIAAYEQDFRNQFAEQIYGGDLQGNFWRFDISDPDDSKWQAAVTQIAHLTDPDGNPQPVTTPPQIEIDIGNGVDRWVFIGTGRLLDDLDLTTSAISDQIQTMYAFRDGTVAAPTSPWPAVLQPRADLLPVTNAAGLAATPPNGWYDDLPVGQRIVVPVQAALSVIAYVGTSPQTDPCLTGQPATLYAREYGRGNSLLVDDSGATIESFFQDTGIVGLSLVTLSGGSSDSGAGGFPDLRIAITAGTPGVKTGFVKPKAPDFAQKHRMSWRLLGQ